MIWLLNGAKKVDLLLTNKRALVTGSSRGIGRAIARALVIEGANVLLNGRSLAALESAAMELSCGFVQGDVFEVTDCERIAEEVEAQAGGLDILVCNVGSGASVPPGQETVAEWERMLRVNLLGTIQVVEKFRSLLSKSEGVILCISSICGMEALGCPIAYAGSKAALNSFVRGAARPLARLGIRINALAPGNIIFPDSVWERKIAENESAVHTMLEREVAMRRLGTAEEIANFAAFLVSPRSSFATGGVFVVDGGQLRG